MINLDHFNTSQSTKENSAFVLTIPQSYLHNNANDLSATNNAKTRLDVISTTLPVFSERDQILLDRDALLERRAHLYNCRFLSFRKSKMTEIKLIDQQIDILENQLILMKKDERESMIAHTQKIIAEVDSLLHRIND